MNPQFSLAMLGMLPSGICRFTIFNVPVMALMEHFIVDHLLRPLCNLHLLQNVIILQVNHCHNTMYKPVRSSHMTWSSSSVGPFSTTDTNVNHKPRTFARSALYRKPFSEPPPPPTPFHRQSVPAPHLLALRIDCDAQKTSSDRSGAPHPNNLANVMPCVTVPIYMWANVCNV